MRETIKNMHYIPGMKINVISWTMLIERWILQNIEQVACI